MEGNVGTTEVCSILAARFKEHGKGRVVMESCAQAFFIAARLLDSGYEVCIVPATFARDCGVGRRRRKTDRQDARALSAASCRNDLPSVHLPSQQSQHTKALCTAR